VTPEKGLSTRGRGGTPVNGQADGKIDLTRLAEEEEEKR
jgi:hypothetical protein